MKRMIFILLPLLIFMSCDWQPTRVSIPAESTFETLNLVLGDTVSVGLSAETLEVTQISDPAIVRVDLIGSDSLSVIGTSVGESIISLAYDPDGSALQGNAYLRVVVTDAEYLQLYMGEEYRISLIHYLTADEIQSTDSIKVAGEDPPSTIAYRFDEDGASLVITGLQPGVETVNFVCETPDGTQIAALAFDMETIIRKRVLAEIFTNAGCVNCPEANENLDHLYLDYPDNFTALRYHVFWTDPRDPMNLYNPTEVEERRVYYGSSFEAPRLFFDGDLESDFDKYQALNNSISQRVTTGTQSYLSYSGYNTSTDSLFIDVSIKNFDHNYDSAIVWTVLTEDSIEYAGTNGETIHNQAMRDMTSSTLATFSSELLLTHSLKLTPDFQMSDRYHIVTFIQNEGTKEILQTIDVAVTEIQ